VLLALRGHALGIAVREELTALGNLVRTTFCGATKRPFRRRSGVELPDVTEGRSSREFDPTTLAISDALDAR
jgi:hypothetical protein